MTVVDSLLVATPLTPGCDDEFLALMTEMRERKDEVGTSRRRAGFTRIVAWYQKSPKGAHSIVYLEGPDPAASLRRLLASTDPFDVDLWGRMRAMYDRTHRPVRLLHRERPAQDDDLAQYLALAIDVLPGKVDELRRLAAEEDVHADDEERYLRLLGLNRLTIWLQEMPWGDVAIYFTSGDVAQSAEVMATSDDPAIVADRAFMLEYYGLDLTVDNLPVPTPTFAWTDTLDG